jgi:pimeloyl-ACP methyl ester carboxylesterase
MKKILTIIGLVLSSTVAVATAAPTKGKFANVNGLDMYYEVHGKGGRPIVLLHGAFCTIDICFGKLIPKLAKTRTVIAIEQQGHGHTLDIDRPMSVPQMAADTAALLQKLDIKDADVIGYSMGSGIAVDLAIKHPELVHKLALISPVFTRAGFHPGLLDGIQQLTPEMMKASPWYPAYLKATAKPEQWTQIVEHIKGLNATYVDIPAKQIQAIKAPAMIIVGDSDIMRPEHVAEMFRTIGGGVAGDIVGLPRAQLAVLPGTTHITVIDRAAYLLAIIPAFLDAPVK